MEEHGELRARRQAGERDGGGRRREREREREREGEGKRYKEWSMCILSSVTLQSSLCYHDSLLSINGGLHDHLHLC